MNYVRKFHNNTTKSTYYYDENDKFHRIDGPAIESLNYNSWHLHGKHHRVDGPSIIHCVNKTMYYEYWINGEKYSKQEFEEIKDFPMLW